MRPYRNRRTSRIWLPTALVAAVLGGCATVPETTSALEEARGLYNQAALTPSVRENAPDELAASRLALARARAADNLAEMNHQSYLAAQHARIAMAMAVQRNAEAQIDSLAAGRGRTDFGAREAQRAEAAAAQADLASLEAKHSDRGYVVTLGDTLFRPGGSDLLPGAEGQITTLADYLRHAPDRQVVVEGYTDDVGSPERNQELSERRAVSVERALVQEGIDPARIGIRGYGESNPVADNSNPLGRELNRRVEVVILNTDQQPLTGPFSP